MFRLVGLIFLVLVIFESVELSPTPPATLCRAPAAVSCYYNQRFFYDTGSRTCQSTLCSACPQAHFFTAAQAVSCCTARDSTQCNSTLVSDPCAPVVPPQRETFGFDPATNQAVSTAASACPLSTGYYYANLTDCETATKFC